MIFLLDSDKQSFGLDNVPKFIHIKAATVKIQCFENLSDFWVLQTRICLEGAIFKISEQSHSHSC